MCFQASLGLKVKVRVREGDKECSLKEVIPTLSPEERQEEVLARQGERR